MTKLEFLNKLSQGLSGLPQDDVNERVIFYSEMIDDRVEEGLSEEEAVSEIGPVDDIVAQIISDIPLTKIVKKRMTPKNNLKAWEIVLLVLGSPIWLSLGIAALAVLFSLYVVLWSVIVTFWAVFITFVATSLYCILVPAIGIFVGWKLLTAIAVFAAGLVLIGLSIYMYFAALYATKGIVLLTKKLTYRIKNIFIKKEEV